MPLSKPRLIQELIRRIPSSQR
ncbi:MAG: hypothetical protein RJB04_2336, partial [Verrucomicrobiota bacterium]